MDRLLRDPAVTQERGIRIGSADWDKRNHFVTSESFPEVRRLAEALKKELRRETPSEPALTSPRGGG